MKDGMVNMSKPAESVLIVDTGFFIAISNHKDQNHERAMKLLNKLSKKSLTYLTTWPVITEVCYLFIKRAPHLLGVFLKAFEDNYFDIHPLTPNDISRMNVLMHKYSEQPMDLADASLVVIAEQLKHGNILTTDKRDFSTYKWNDKHPFNILL